jgi:hypothetical protein
MSKLMSGLAIAAIASTAFVGAVSAQDRADSGNGGVSTSDSSGGAVTVGTTNTGSVNGSTTVVDAAGLLGTDNLAEAIILAVLGATGAEDTEDSE